MPSKLSAYISFEDSAREALEFYQQVFGGDLALSTFGEFGQTGPMAKNIMHGQLDTPSGYTLMASDTPPGMEREPGHTIKLILHGDDEAELRRVWNGLIEGGSVQTESGPADVGRHVRPVHGQVRHCLDVQHLGMKVLYVCTANICRSASAAALSLDAGLDARSAGSAALRGQPGCSVAPALRGREHSSQPLSADLVAWADLILTAARENQPAVTALDPRARPRTFTILQAARLCQWLIDAGMLEAATSQGTYPEGDPRALVTPLGQDRTAWLVAELDAARGMAPLPATEPPRRRRARQSDVVPSPDDLVDPHVTGEDVHETNDVLISAAVDALVATLAAVQRA